MQMRIAELTELSQKREILHWELLKQALHEDPECAYFSLMFQVLY